MASEVRQRKKAKSEEGIEKPEEEELKKSQEQSETLVTKLTPKWTYMISPLLAIIITTSADTFLDNKVSSLMFRVKFPT